MNRGPEVGGSVVQTMNEKRQEPEVRVVWDEGRIGRGQITLGHVGLGRHLAIILGLGSHESFLSGDGT